MRMFRWRQCVRLLALAVSLLPGAEAAFAADAAAPVAMVSDLQGKGTLIAGKTRAPLALLTDVDAGAQVELEANARLVALYLDGSGEYTIKGPALVAFGAQQPQVLKGAAAEKRSVLGGKGRGVEAQVAVGRFLEPLSAGVETRELPRRVEQLRERQREVVRLALERRAAAGAALVDQHEVAAVAEPC